MQINEKLYDKYGNVLYVKSISGNKYSGQLMKCEWYASENGITKGKAMPVNVKFSDSDMGVSYFYKKQDIGNREVLLNPNGAYANNLVNIKAQFNRYLKSLKDSLPYGTFMPSEEKQNVINSFFDNDEKKKDELFIKKHPQCFARMDLDSNFRVGHEVKYFDEHFHDTLYITKGVYNRLENVQIVNWRSEIASLYYSKDRLNLERQYYLDVFDETKETGVAGREYKYSLMLRREYSKNPFIIRDSYVCGAPQTTGSSTQEVEKIEEIQELYKNGGIDPFLIKVIQEKRGENKLTDIITSIQSNQNEMIRHTPKKNMIVQGCAGSGKTMILLHRLSYLTYNKYLRSFNRAVIIVPNTKFSLFIDELSGNLEIDEIPRFTMPQYYLSLIEKYQNKVY